ncbi:MAG: three-Cys-motif partner protein TcmP, partial [Candidatus Marinimicrobia bacterium]|nr:three-Cys-motif partner protein TcmP [Candidatus Neomarinimicrobiota bacterium]
TRIGKPEILLYFDGFSGPGVYWKDEKRNSTCPGSPIIVAEIANKFIESKLSREFIIITVDKRKESVEMLSTELANVNKYDQPWKAHFAEFDEAVNSLFDQIENKSLYIPPMFIFIDPFGYAGFPLRTLKRILKYKRTELFINFMIYDIVRFCDSKEHEHRMYDLFGCWDFKKAREYTSPEKKQLYLKNLYCEQLKESAKARFVMPFRINTPEQGTRPRYYLIHASQNIKALKEMKDSMAKVSDSPYQFEAIGLSSDQFSLFEDPGKISLKERINTFCKDAYPQALEYTEIENWSYVYTNGVKRTIKDAIVNLEQDERVEIIRKPGQKKTTVTKGATIVHLN